MNALERLLQDDLNRLSDRIAARLGDATAAGVRSRDPELYQRLELSSAQLADLRLELTERYAAWADAVEECEALWGRAEARAEAERMTLERRAA
jgi:hypothetical protein